MGRELVRSFVVGGIAILLLFFGLWLFLRYHEHKQTELAGYATAKALAEQIAIHRQIYATEVVPRARRAGIAVDVGFETTDHTLPLPVSLVNMVGDSLAAQVPGSRVRVFSRQPFKFRGAVALDSFQADALTAVENHPERPFYRLESLDGSSVIRYAVADVMRAECVACHNAHAESPRRDWRIGEVRGAIEVTIPIEDLATTIRAAHVNFSVLLVLGLLVGGLGVGLFVRHDLRRIRREHVAMTDPTTQLPTRGAVMARIGQTMEQARRHRTTVSVVVFDVDRFKQINDQFGHAMGDRVLEAIGGALSSGVREHDIVARWGGEEFLAVFPKVGRDEAREIAERIRTEMSARSPDGVAVTVSAGVAESAAGEPFAAIVARADAKLYEAKQGGRDAVR